MNSSRRRTLHWILRWHGLLLALGWVLNNLRWAHIFGLPYLVADSRARYLPYARDIAERGYFAPGHEQYYVGYPLWLSGWLKLGAGPAGAAWGQLVLAGAAGVALYHALHRLTRRRATAIVGTALLVLWPDTQQFNGFILTESLVTSGLVFVFAALVWVRDQIRPAAWLLPAGVALLTMMLRPNAFVLPGAVAVAGLTVLARRYGAARVWGGVLAGFVLAIPVLWWGFNTMMPTFRLIEPYARGEVIYGAQVLALSPPADLWIPPYEWPPLERLVTFAAHNPLYLLRLMVSKMSVFLFYAKPYHSWVHIALIVGIVWPAYWLALRGSRNRTVWPPARWFLVTVVLGQTLVIGLTLEDWDGRFLIAVLPAVFALAALGLLPPRRLTAAPPPAPSAAAR